MDKDTNDAVSVPKKRGRKKKEVIEEPKSEVIEEPKPEVIEELKPEVIEESKSEVIEEPKLEVIKRDVYGFVVTTHHDNYNLIKKCLDLLFKHIPQDSYVVLYLNEPKGKVINIELEYKKESNRLKVIHIKDQQKNGGLTGTWNQGIDYLLSLKDVNCNVITILGHDTFINDSIKYLLEAGKIAHEKDELKYFGPLFKTFPGKNGELWQDELQYKNHTLNYLIGSIMTFPKNSLIKNKLTKVDNNNYFNAKRYPFGHNEIDWFKRFIKINGKADIITNCIIEHEYKHSWVNYDKNLNKSLRTEEDNINPIKEKLEELNFNWINYLKKNPDLKNKGIQTSIQALNHYMTIGKNQGRKY
jgi:hypothetical protein